MAILSKRLSGASVWTGSSLRAADDWIDYLDAKELKELDDALASAKAHGKSRFEIVQGDFPLPNLSKRLAGLRDVLEGGRGFAVLRGIPAEKYSLEDAKTLAWGIAVHVGVPESQDAKGSLLHSVTDTGKEVEGNDSNRGYETDDELKFHNDGGDAFMLFCLRTAKSGGISKLVSVGALFNKILSVRPDLAEVLQHPFHFDARQQNPQGIRVQSVPIFNFHAGYLSALYKRRHITLAQRFPEVPRLSPLQVEALDMVDAICNDPETQLSFSMQPGDLQLGNNYAVLHSRTKYVDQDDPDLRRHLLRIWFSLPNGRPLPDTFADTREFGPTYRRRMARAPA